jgi:O-antigen/teichoic acid export membrane protein
MLLTMGVSLYTSRVILNALGVDDYGIYNVVGGVVAMFGILSGSLSAAISRFITFELGKGDFEKLKRIFCTSVNIQVILIAIITILMETIGIWFLNAKMVIPEERLAAANWVFQFSVVTFALNLLSVPYNAVIIAHEKMSAFAYISIIDCALKLIVAFIIAYNPFDKLVYYGLLIMIVGAINRSIYAIYCKRHFEEATYRMIFDKGLMKEMFGFAGWNFIGASSAVLRDQGGNILLNLFYGTTVNAARGIAMQVSSAVTSFVHSFMTAVNPQITKSYAAGNTDYMMKLVFQSTKFSFFILLLIALPVIITTPYLLDLWLVDVPEYGVSFVRLILVYALCESLSGPLITVMLATGNIKNYQIIVGGCQMLNFPVCYVCFRLGMQPEAVFVVAIIICVLCEMLRLIMLKKMVGLSISAFLTKVYFKAIFVALLSAFIPIISRLFLDDNFISSLVLIFVSIICVGLSAYFIGCDKSEKAVISTQILKVKNKFFR